MILDVIKELQASTAKRKIYYFDSTERARKTRTNWFRQLKHRDIERKVYMEQKENSIAVELIDEVDLEVIERKPEEKPKEKPKEKPDRGAYLDKQTTKILPGTMESLRRIANTASEMHMSYGQYVAKYGDRL